MQRSLSAGLAPDLGPNKLSCMQSCGDNCMALRSALQELLLHMLVWVCMPVKAQGCTWQHFLAAGSLRLLPCCSAEGSEAAEPAAV